jgi:hypothetical protein
MSIDTSGKTDSSPGLPRGTRPRRPIARIAALIVACAVVAGGAFAATEAVSGAGPSAPAAAAAAAVPAAGPAGQAAVLNGVLAVASGTATAPGTAAERVALRRLRRALARLRRLGGMYGQFSFETKKGPRTLAFERGTVTSVAGADVAVRATDGTTWTWVLTGSSVVREDGARTKATALAAGEQVFAGGLVSGATRDARLIVIRETGKQPA